MITYAMHANAVCVVATVTNSTCAVITSDGVLTDCVWGTDWRRSVAFLDICNERYRQTVTPV